MLDALHVGCGPSRLPEPLFPAATWRETRLDIDPGMQPDIVASITSMPVADGTFGAVFSSHNLEHLAPHEVPVALREFYRVLRKDGFCVIAVPDMGAAAREVAEGRAWAIAYDAPCGPITAMDMIFGHAEMRRENPFMAHRTGFTAASLRAEMESAGFRVVGVDARDWNLTAIGVRDGDGA